MWRTFLIEGVPPAQYDRDVLRAFVGVAAVRAEGTTEYEVAVRNPNGHIYRIIKLQGLAEKVNFEKAMRELGFEPEQSERYRKSLGLDAVYGRS